MTEMTSDKLHNCMHDTTLLYDQLSQTLKQLTAAYCSYSVVTLHNIMPIMPIMVHAYAMICMLLISCLRVQVYAEENTYCKTMQFSISGCDSDRDVHDIVEFICLVTCWHSFAPIHTYT